MKHPISHFEAPVFTSTNYENVQELEDFPFMYKHAEYDGLFVPNHWHESLEIIYIESGHMRVELQEKTIDLYGHDFIIINSSDIHNTITIGMTRSWILQLPPEFMVKIIPDYRNIRFENPFFPGSSQAPSSGIRGNRFTDKIRSDLSMMCVVFSQKNEGYICAFLSLVYDLLFLLDTNAKVKISPTAINKTQKNLDILTKVTGYVRKNYKDKISLSEAASIAGLQQEYFCRFFRKHMGMSFLEYVNEIRFSKVYNDLMNTDLSIQEILYNRGFTNYKLFMKMFKDRYNTTPLKKRKTAVNQ